MTVTNANRIGDLLNLVHDHWFNVERVALDKESRIVTMHLEAKKTNLVQGSKDGSRLLIKNAEGRSVNDTEKVRDFDLNEIKFDPASGCVFITGGIPITIKVKVTALEIEVL
jgi:hypothetical protein